MVVAVVAEEDLAAMGMEELEAVHLEVPTGQEAWDHWDLEMAVECLVDRLVVMPVRSSQLISVLILAVRLVFLEGVMVEACMVIIRV